VALARKPNESFNADANTGHRFASSIVGALRLRLRRRLTRALGIMKLRAKQLYVSLALALVGTFYALGHWAINVRFQSPALNYLAFVALVFSVPVLFMASAKATHNRLAKAVLYLIGIASVLPAIPLVTFSVIEALDIIKSGKDGSFDKVAEMTQGSKALRLYVSN
jgi:hypothetical protein